MNHSARKHEPRLFCEFEWVMDRKRRSATTLSNPVPPIPTTILVNSSSNAEKK
jgi:hypothetical protein